MILDIDHVMVCVHDSERAGRQFEELGFHVTPKSELTALGLSNRCILFQPENDRCANFIELMAIEDPSICPPFMKCILGEREGPVSFVLATADVDSAATKLRARGVPCLEPIQVRREWRLSDDDIVHPAFGVCIPEPGQFRPYWNLCQYHTRDLYVRPDLTTHPNGVARINGFSVAVDDPEASARFMSRSWDIEPTHDSGTWSVAPGQVRLSLTARDAAPETPTGLNVRMVMSENHPGSSLRASLYGLELLAA